MEGGVCDGLNYRDVARGFRQRRKPRHMAPPYQSKLGDSNRLISRAQPKYNKESEERHVDVQQPSRLDLRIRRS